MSFLQAGLDNVPINQSLEFRFSEPVEPTSVSTSSIQVRIGPSFGLTAAGSFEVAGDRVFFHPRLPTLCGYADAGFQPGTTFQVSLLGSPEFRALKNTRGEAISETLTFEFTTLPETNPDFLTDPDPGTPTMVSSSPADGDAAVSVSTSNEIRIQFSENLDPCSVTLGSTIKVYTAALGDRNVSLAAPNGNDSGFDPVADGDPSPTVWSPNQTDLVPVIPLLGTAEVVQTATSTEIVVTPQGGRFPENALIVVELSGNITDFGGLFLTPEVFSFTTQNLPPAASDLTLTFDDSTPINGGETTGDVNTARSPGLAQGWVGFGGDGDNGAAPLTIPAFPTLDNTGATFVSCAARANDGSADDFDATADVTLSTGDTPIPSTCPNEADGSTAVVFEFSSFRIRAGVRVTIEGVNPCIIKVRGAVLIEAGATLDVRGIKGGNGGSTCSVGGASGAPRGGGGEGGEGGYQSGSPSAYAGDGTTGYGASDAGDSPGTAGGNGGVNAIDPPGWGGSGVGGGGGGHATVGADGAAQLSGTGQFAWAASPVEGGGGGTYPVSSTTMRTAEAGSGGGGGGCAYWSFSNGWETTSCTSYMGAGGGGGSGGGFVGLTANGDITVSGAILANGGNGGNGGTNTYNGGAGGGGGSGGGIRLLTPGRIILSGATLSCAGGLGGAGDAGNYANSGGTTNQPHRANGGGDGGVGRIVLEDADSVIEGLGSATLVPAEGSDGFYRGVFDATRFVSGGNENVVVTEPILLGPILDPSSVVFQPLFVTDFVAGIPDEAAIGGGAANIVIEMRGFQPTPDYSVDLGSATGWYTVGYFASSGIETQPGWTGDASPAGWVPDAGVGLSNLNGNVFVQARITLILKPGQDPDDAGPYIDNWIIRYTSDQ